MANTISPNPPLEPKHQNLPKVLLLHPPPVYLLLEAEFSLHFHFLKAYESPLPIHQFLAAANSAGVTAMFATSLGPPITGAGILDHIPSLRCIVTSTTGVDFIDLDECRRRGIAVANAANLYADDCADAAVSLLIDVLRKISTADRFVRNGDWSVKGEFPLGHRLGGKRIGIVGLGSIGLGVAKRLEAFGCSISYNSREKKPSVAYPFYSDVQELAANNDVLVICCALTEKTRHMISKQVLLALGKEGIIINIARGPIVDEEELVRFLLQGQLAGVGLDVFEHEPSVPKELVALDNVVLSPHRAACTEEAFHDLYEHVKRNLLAFFSNKRLLSPVV